MTYRPLVVPDSVRVDVRLRSESEAVYLTLDGQVGFPMRTEDTVSVDGDARPVRLVRTEDRSYFQVLRRKLRWGER
jgi:NAD+ kinase